jgi:hypothetical protein
MGTDALLYGNTVTKTIATKESASYKSHSGGDPKKIYPHTKLDGTPYTTSDQAEEAGDSVGPSAMAAGDQSWTDTIWNYLATNPFGDTYFGETIKTLVYIVMAGDYWAPGDAVNPTPSATTSSPTPSASPTPSPTASPTPTGPAGGKSYEAESATLAGGVTVTHCAHCSGTNKISYLGNGGTVTFTGIGEPATGSYTMTVYYLSVGGAKSAVITADGVAQTVSFAETPDYNTVASTTVTVTLKAGTANTIEFSNPDAGGPNLDRIVV